MVLRLDPTVPLVWRDPTTLQFGIDPMVAVIPDVTPALERLVAVLASGVSETGYPMMAGTLGVTPPEAARLRDAVEPCLLGRRDERASPPSPRTVAVLGNTPLAYGIARLLDDLGIRTADLERPDLVMLVGDRVIPPADHRGWLQRDIPHLAVIASDASITVGHVVEPGVTACLHCIDLHRRDADPSWPAIATQLAALPPPQTHPLRTASAAVLAARAAAGRLRDGPAGAPREVRITSDGDEVTVRRVLPHPECRCATPQESDWAPAGGPEALHPTTTATASAAHG